MRIRLTQIDGKLPNLALMKLAHWHRSQGHEAVFTRRVHRDLLEGDYDIVYGSAIFSASQPAIERFKREWPGAILGGTGSGTPLTVEEVIGQPWECYDYQDYPSYQASLGFTARGCRMSCKFCVVPLKEGKPRPVNDLYEIWRGNGHPKRLHLLDNDFFGQPKDRWLALLGQAREGGFQICFNQGINIRTVDDEVAAAIASHLVAQRNGATVYRYRDDGFVRPRLYTAWDNLKDEGAFFRGVDALEHAGIPPYHLFAYMLCGFDQAETIEHVLYRFDRMVARGIKPYPMVYDSRRKDLKAFQRWAVTGIYRAGIPFSEYNAGAKMSRIKVKSYGMATLFP
jgi:hypothetical protein